MKKDKALSRVEITQRNRARHKILNEEMKRNGLSKKSVFVNDVLYARLKELANEFHMATDEMIFVAMRDFLSNHDGCDYGAKAFYCLEDTALLAHARMETAGLGGLKAFSPKKGRAD
jgi:hypothetical protein